MKRLIIFFAFLVVPLWLTIVLGGSLTGTIGALVVGLAGPLLLILAHEMGHVVVGTREGLPLRWLAVGPLLMDMTKGRRIRRGPFGGGVGGAAVFDLGDLTDEEVGRALCRMSAGGPVASFLLAVVCLGLSIVLAGTSPFLGWALQYLGGFSLLLGIINAIPFRAGPMRSDGSTYLTLIRGGEAAASVVRAARLIEPGQNPTRPADWPEATVALMRETVFCRESPRPARLDEWLTAVQLLYWHELDRGRVDAAYGVLRQVAVAPRDAKAVKKQRYAAIDLLTALHLALWEGGGESAAGIVAHLPKRSFLRRAPLWTGTEGAILLARGEVHGALLKAKQAQRRLTPFADLVGMFGVEQRCWANLIARAEAAIVRMNRSSVPPVFGVAPVPLVPALAVAETAMPVAPIPHAQVAPTMGRPVAWTPAPRPETALWLGRSFSTTGSNGVLNHPAPIPFPTIAGLKPDFARPRPAVPIPTSSIPVALVKAAGATLALAAALPAVVVMFGAVLVLLVSEDYQGAIGGVMLAFGYAIILGIAAWIWRQVGAVWGMSAVLFLVLTFPLYVYRQNRGMVKRETGEPVREFRTLLTAGSMLATFVLLIGLLFGVAFYQEAAHPTLDVTRSSYER